MNKIEKVQVILNLYVASPVHEGMNSIMEGVQGFETEAHSCMHFHH